MPTNDLCILCNQSAQKTQIQGRDEYIFRCKTCGNYSSDGLMIAEFETSKTQEQKAMISAYTRELYEFELDPPKLNVLADSGEIERIIERYMNKSYIEKFDNLILFLSRKTNFYGHSITVNLNNDYPITFSNGREEFEYIFINKIASDGLIRTAGTAGASTSLKLTWEGLEKAAEIESRKVISKNCFVAMSFDASLNEAYDDGIKPAIEQAGYTPIRIDKEEHNEKICDLIIAEIRKCKFLVADMTMHKQNVYYEAGFLQGLGRDIIFTCREDEIKNVHFDTRQYNHIVWSDPEDLRKKLLARIEATII